MVDAGTSQEELLEESQEYKFRKTMLMNALSVLMKEKNLFLNHVDLKDPQSTLDELSKNFKISRERVRQIEVKAFEKVQNYIKHLMKDKNKSNF